MPKRKIEEDSTQKKQTKLDSFLSKSEAIDELTLVQKPVLVVLPGASGNITKNMKEFLSLKLEDIFEIRISEHKWNGWKTNSKENVALALNLCPKTDIEWYILGNSFGNRVIASICENNLFPYPPKKIIMFGYPLYGPNLNNERVNGLLQIPSNYEILFISGSNDEFINRKPVNINIIGKDLLESIINQMKCKNNIQLEIISDCNHGVVDGTKSKNKLLQLFSLISDKIIQFIQN